jgi:predicted ATPase
LIENDLAMVLTERFEQVQRGEAIPAAPATRANYVPRPPTPLVGRERELAAMKVMLARSDVGLLTLSGPGGTGKTRLALQVALDLVDDFEHGVYFVALASIADPHLVPTAIAQALDIHEARDGRPILESLKDYLRDKYVLLVLDNFEQVVLAGPIVVELLEVSPRLKVLVTSRMLLRVRGEKELPVMPLEVPERRRSLDAERLSQYASVELFIQRAQAVKPGFEITNESAPAVAEICYRLDGLPLAIELAAARIRILTPQALLTRLEHRLDVLRGGPRDLPARQQTLRSAIDWSHNLLDDQAKRLFRRLSVFVGGWTLDAAGAICNATGDLDVDVLDEMESLIDNSLLTSAEEADGEMRYGMLETIREYARERLSESGEEDSLRWRHAEYFLALAEAIEPKLGTSERRHWLDRLEIEHDNMRAALTCSRLEKCDPSIGLRLGGALAGFWQTRAYLHEGRKNLETALARPDASAHIPARAKALWGAGGLAWSLGDYAVARAYLEESMAIAREVGDRRQCAYALTQLGLVIVNQGDVDSASPLYAEAVELFREVKDAWGEAFALTWLAEATLISDRPLMAQPLYEEGLTLWRKVGDPWGTGIALLVLGALALAQGDVSKSYALLEEGTALLREGGDRWTLTFGITGLADVLLWQGDYEQAKVQFEVGLTFSRESGNPAGMIISLVGLAGVAAGLSPHESSQRREEYLRRAAALVGAADALREALGLHLLRIMRLTYEPRVAMIRTQIDEAIWGPAWAEGHAMGLERAIAYALEKDPRA